MATIINSYGVEIDANVALNLMDEQLVEYAWDNIWNLEECRYPDNEMQSMFDEYCKLHQQKYGEEFELSKPNPVY